MVCPNCGYNAPDDARHCTACGTPLGVHMSVAPPAPYEQAAKASRARRLVMFGCLGALVLMVLFAAGMVMFVFSLMRSSEPYQEAMRRAKASPGVAATLGEPIEAGRFVTGSVNVSGPSGDANLSIPISGPKGSGTIYVIAEKRAGKWEYKLLEFQPSGQTQRLDLLREGQRPVF